jgi:pimeloyl-ACP methyl ester carboxylesterase
VIAPLAKFIDWVSIQKCFLGRPAPDMQSIRMTEAVQFLNGPDFIPTASQPAQVAVHSDNAGGLNLRFPTPRPASLEENNTVHGRLYPGPGQWHERPAIILLHGGNLMRGRAHSLGYRFGYPRIARRCNRAGFNAVTVELPYNFQRHPRQPEALRDEDYLRMAEATAQAIAEIRALTGWLLQEGCPAVALWGVSLGGWLAGLCACHEARLAAAVMIVPIVRSNAAIADQIIPRSRREAWQPLFQLEERLDATPFNLTTGRPAIPKEKILLVGGRYDLTCPMKPIEELCKAWGHPTLWRLPHGHISFMSERGLTDRSLQWLKSRLEIPKVR